MVLELSNAISRPRDYYGYGRSQTKNSFLPNVFLKNFAREKTDVPAILKARINENHMDLVLMHMIEPDASFTSSGWIDYYYEGGREGGKNKPSRLGFKFPDGYSYDFILKSKQNFHDTAYTIFKRKKDKHDRKKTLEYVGLKTTEKLEININYETPIAFWRGLPKEFRENIREFLFAGNFYNIFWPNVITTVKNREIHEAKITEQLGVRISDKIDSEKREDEFKRLKETLIETGIVRYQFEEEHGTGSFYHPEKHLFLINPHHLHQFLINPPHLFIDKFDYKYIESLEDIIREDLKEFSPTKNDFRSNKAEISINGEFDRDILSKVPEDFEKYLKYNKCSIKGGNITVNYNGNINPDKVYISIENSSLEEVERLSQLITGNEAVIIEAKEKDTLKKHRDVFYNDGRPRGNQNWF